MPLVDCSRSLTGGASLSRAEAAGKHLDAHPPYPCVIVVRRHVSRELVSRAHGLGLYDVAPVRYVMWWGVDGGGVDRVRARVSGSIESAPRESCLTTTTPLCIQDLATT